MIARPSARPRDCMPPDTALGEVIPEAVEVDLFDCCCDRCRGIDSLADQLLAAGRYFLCEERDGCAMIRKRPGGAEAGYCPQQRFVQRSVERSAINQERRLPIRDVLRLR